MASVNPSAQSGFLLKFGEILMLCFIPIGMLQVLRSKDQWELQMVIRTPILLSVLGGMLFLSAVIAYLWGKKGGGRKLHGIFQTLVVLYLAFWISTYGAAKILGTQFQPPHFILETPIGDLNGFWLTWTYYGFSHTMALILGWTQVIGCTLILFRATRLLGAFILLPVMLNIDLIDHFFKISPLAYYNALQYTFLLFVLLLIDFPVLKGIFLAYRNKARVHSRWVLLNVLRVGVVALAFVNISMLRDSFTARSRLNGVWKVDSLVQHRRVIIPSSSGGMAWSKLYFEWRYGCIFKYDPLVFQPKDMQGQYSIDEKAGTLGIGFPKGEGKEGVDSMKMHYLFVTDSLAQMQGTYKDDSLLMYVRKLK
jgi:hypothetical protein